MGKRETRRIVQQYMADFIRAREAIDLSDRLMELLPTDQWVEAKYELFRIADRIEPKERPSNG